MDIDILRQVAGLHTMKRTIFRCKTVVEAKQLQPSLVGRHQVWP